MPLILRVTHDMFELEEVCDYLCNPVNIVGVAGAGIALELRKRYPYYFEPYQQACKSKELRIGTVKVLEQEDHQVGIILIPTKRHYADTSNKEDIIRSLEALRDLLKTPQYRYTTIVMPMLGCGLGKMDYEVVYPLMEEFLGNLEATIFICMSPNKTELKPKYLTIVGPVDYGQKPNDQTAINWVIDKVLEGWNLSFDDYTNIVSGGFPGVDTYVCGTDYLHNYQASYVFKKCGKIPLVCKPNQLRNGVASNLINNNLLCEIADDIILFKPKGYNNNRMSLMQTWLEADRQRREREGLFPKRIAVYGEKESKFLKEDIIIPEDIPY